MYGHLRKQPASRARMPERNERQERDETSNFESCVAGPVALGLRGFLPSIAGGQSAAPARSRRASRRTRACGAAKPYTPPKTADGQPDLQGFWTNSTYVPLERPNGVTKEFYTPDGGLAAEKRAAEREAEQTEPGTVADVHYDFSQFGLDRSQSTFARSLRTSLIVDPPDGKIPPVTAEGQKRAADARPRARRWAASTTPSRTCRSARAASSWAGAGPPMMNAGYNSQLPDRAGPGLRDDPHRDDPRRPHHPARRPRRRRRRACASGRASRAAAGKATRWWSRRRTSTARTRSAAPART